MVPGPAASASPGNLLGMQILGATPGGRDQEPWGCLSEIYFHSLRDNSDAHSNLRTTVLIEYFLSKDYLIS